MFCGVFSPDGRSFVTATQDHIIRIINVDKVDGSEEIIETEDGRKEIIPLSRRGDQVIRKRLSIGAGGWSILDLALAPDSQTGKLQFKAFLRIVSSARKIHETINCCKIPKLLTFF